MDLDISKDARGERTEQGLAIDTKHVITQVLVENGGTVVIGGIFEMEETSQEEKIPLLGDVPVVGNLSNPAPRNPPSGNAGLHHPKVITDRGSVR